MSGLVDSNRRQVPSGEINDDVGESFVDVTVEETSAKDTLAFDADDRKTKSFLAEADRDAPASPEMRGKSAELASISFKPRAGAIWLFLLVATSYSLNTSQIASELNQMKTTLQVKLGWEAESSQERWLYSGLNGIKNVGGLLGAIAVGNILNYGRRSTLLIIAVIMFVGVALFQWMNIYSLMFGRLIAIIGSGMTTVAVNRMIEEYVPLAMYSTASPFNIFVGQFGTFLALLSGLTLPKDGAKVEEFEDTVVWRYIFGFSLVMCVVSFVGFLCFVRTDTPKFYLVEKNEPGALKAIHTIYDTSGVPYQANKIMSFIQKSCNQNVAKVSFYDALIGDERYVRACWVNIALMSFHVLTGYSAVMSYSNTIFKNAQKEGSGGLTPRQGTVLVGVCNLLAAMAGIYTVKTFGRRTILLAGHSAIAVLHFLIAFSIIAGWGNIQIVLTCVFIFAYMCTSGPGAWAYAAETCCDAGLSAVVLCFYFWECMESFSTEALMAWSPTGTFFMFGTISTVSVVFLWLFVGETKGLNEKEKKEIFMPGATWGRPLRAGEQPVAELGVEHKSRRTLRSEMILSGHISIQDDSD